jgi:hypothetical protein
MALPGRRDDGAANRNAREFIMSNSSAKADLLLPFGSLTGLIPIDSIRHKRVLGDFSSVIGTEPQLARPRPKPVHAGSEPASTAWLLSL